MQNANSITVNIGGTTVTIDVKIGTSKNEAKNETQTIEPMQVETAPKVEEKEVVKRTLIEHAMACSNIFALIQSNLLPTDSLYGKISLL